MKIRITFLCLLLVMASWMLSGCQKRISTELTVQPITPKDYNHVLPPGKLALRKITDPAQIPDYTLACSDTDRLREAIANSLNYLAKPSSKQHYPYGDIPYEQAVKSLRELDRLVAMRLPPREMNSVLRERFDTYISVGCDDQGTVLFTGYYTPIFDGSSLWLAISSKSSMFFLFFKNERWCQRLSFVKSHTGTGSSRPNIDR